MILLSPVEALDLSQIESAVEWFESQNTGKNEVTNDDLMLRAAKKLADIPVHIRQLSYQTFIGRKQVQNYAPKLSKGYFTKSGLEQRTHPVIANYRASFFSKDDIVIEIGSGLGFDTASLSKNVKKIFCIEKDPIHAQFAKYNLSLLGILNAEIILDDFGNIKNYQSIVDSANAIYADPARRTAEGAKVKNGFDYSPSLDKVIDFASGFETASIKVSPTYKETHSSFYSEWIGFDKECKERILWRAKNKNNSNQVSILLDDNSFSTFEFTSEDLLEINILQSTEQLIDGFILFPHAALLASNKEETFAAQNGLLMFPPNTALFYSQEVPKQSLFYDSFQVLDVQPFDLKKLPVYIEKLGWNTNTELKKKNFPIEPESLRSKLKLLPHTDVNKKSGVVIFTQFNKQQIMIFAKRL